MFDIGWSEMAIIAVIVLVVLGPKELPHALKTVSHWMRTARKLGSEFQSGVNEIVRDAELEDARKQLQGISKNSIEKKIEKAIDPTGDIKKTMNETAAAAKMDTPADKTPTSTPTSLGVPATTSKLDEPKPVAAPAAETPVPAAEAAAPAAETATTALPDSKETSEKSASV